MLTTRTSRRLPPSWAAETAEHITESIARFFSTGCYLLLHTIVVLLWVALNLFALKWRWDPYPINRAQPGFSPHKPPTRHRSFG